MEVLLEQEDDHLHEQDTADHLVSPDAEAHQEVVDVHPVVTLCSLFRRRSGPLRCSPLGRGVRRVSSIPRKVTFVESLPACLPRAS